MRFTSQLDKLTDFVGFKAHPDETIATYTLPIGKKESRQKLDECGLWVKILKTTARKSKKVKLKKDFYYGEQGKLVKFLGSAKDLNYKTALKMAKELSVGATPKGKAFNTLGSVFDSYLSFGAKRWAPQTMAKKLKIYKKFAPIKDKDVSRIKADSIFAIADKLYHSEKFAALKDFLVEAKMVFSYAKNRQKIDKNPLADVDFSKIYAMPESDGFGHIETDKDLRSLIAYCCDYAGSRDVRNALVLGLCTALRAANVRFLSRENLARDENGYYLVFLKDEMKVKRNGDMYLGIPQELGEWLDSMDVGTYFFMGRSGEKALSDAILSKALKDYTPETPKGRIVFHSFRGILSTFAHEVDEGDVSDYDMSRTLSHAIKGVEKHYNKSKAIATTRRVLTWWFNYLKDRGLKL
jgi:hypothetical protein|nr:MAG TPA: Integrase [Bacteriophage sp.]